MSYSLTQLRNNIVTSVYGRRLGLDKDDFIINKGERNPATELTSASTAQILAAFGITLINVTSLATTGTNTFTIPLPVLGARVKYGQGVYGTTSTQGSTAIQVTRVSTAFYIKSSEGTTGVAITLPFGTVVELTGISTDSYHVTGRSGSLAVVGAS